MGNVSREMGTKKEPKGNARNEKHWWIKNDFDGLISRLDGVKKRTSELEDVLTETYTTKM